MIRDFIIWVRGLFRRPRNSKSESAGEIFVPDPTQPELIQRIQSHGGISHIIVAPFYIPGDGRVYGDKDSNRKLRDLSRRDPSAGVLIRAGWQNVVVCADGHRLGMGLDDEADVLRAAPGSLSPENCRRFLPAAPARGSASSSAPGQAP
mgnify:CR=1 FL=1